MLVITGEIADTVGQDQATLVVNDIKIHILREQITDQQAVNTVVDDVITTTEQAAAQAAEAQGKAAPAKLGEVEHEKLYNFGYKFSQMGYKYKDMQQTLERVTHNVTQSTGIDDPITDTFTTINDDTGLSIDSILLNTDDNVLGEDAIINATNTVALGDHPAEPIEVYTGDARLTESGKIKADGFIGGSNDIAYKDVNGAYALIDLNGNLLTESVYTDNFDGEYGWIRAVLNDGSYMQGLLSEDGSVVVPFQYDVVEVLGKKWAAAATLTESSEDDYDYYGFSGGYFQIAVMELYYLGESGGVPVASLTRDQYAQAVTLGDYLNIQDRSGAVTTYDPAFNALRTSDYISDFGEYEDDSALSALLSERTGYYVGAFRGNYARASADGKYGVMDRYGNLIVPLEFENIASSYYGDSYVGGGYFAAERNGCFLYVVAGGEVTGNYSYPFNEVNNYGMSASYKAEDGSIILLAGDGRETNLGTAYDRVNPIRESKGMFWTGASGSEYDLLDWHGNVLLTGSDGYSLSENGNYLIAENGYTSSTLYLVNDASPVNISESIGGAVELEAAFEEGASLEAYTEDPQVEPIGETVGTRFVAGTSLLLASDGSGYALVDVSGKQLTNPDYTSQFAYHDGWLVAEREAEGGSLYGVLSLRGVEIIPCEYNHVDVLNEHWVAAYHLADSGTEDDYDFQGFYSDARIYYQIADAVIYHIGEEELTSVTLTRDQILDIDAEEDYLNIKDRTTGAVTTYDASFTAVASVNSVSDFSGVSSRSVMIRSLQDSTEWSLSDYDFPDGYTRVYDNSGDSTQWGVVDMRGNLVVPVEYDDVLTNYNRSSTHFWANGYFAVSRDGMVGFVNGNGEVTCELKYPKDSFICWGMAGRLQNEDGTLTLVAADGTETPGFEHLSGYANGKFWRAEKDNEYILVDWHGNVVFEKCYSADVSEDEKFLIVQKDYDEPYELYAVDGATVEEAVGAGSAGEPAGQEDVGADEKTSAEAEAGTDAGAPAKPGPDDGAPADSGQETKGTAEQTETEQEKASEDGTANAGADAAQSDPAENGDGAQTDAQAGAKETSSAAEGILTAALQLVTTDMTANRDSILVLLQQAAALLETENPDAAAVLNSAVTLLQSGTEDANSVSTLIGTVQGML